jgi:hypothetical protein
LAGNAVKFTEKGKVEMRVVAGDITPDGKREITFTVSDTGIGSRRQEGTSISNFQSGGRIAFPQLRRHRPWSCHQQGNCGTDGGNDLLHEQRGGGKHIFLHHPTGTTRLENNALPAAEPILPETITPDLEAKGIPRILLAEDDSITGQVILQMLKQLEL